MTSSCGPLPIDRLDPTITTVGLALYVFAAALVADLLGRMQDSDRRTARHSLQMQAWQLRQLVPRATTLQPT